MLNHCTIQGIVKLGVVNLKITLKKRNLLNPKTNLEFGNTLCYLLLLKCRSTSDIQGWSLELGLPYLYLN